ncbi:Winged helix DNA-binding domain-containing protein [Amycolatopsis arida]|uniref:Winged helix DNA-binding domain-containing protein n=1 Tax=Amycolatopsis arida TaxID=587909 RepID=A0A1I5ZBX0_9PSEU|nr:winged helix DNA-binding protein [Amycolatopsis arida]SFQ53959.1 Winged helix DNA-binding domain-containing protein [Amycolatopsis arida]
MQYLEPLVHPAPSGTWNTHGATPFPAAEWTGVRPEPTAEDLRRLVRRYLAAFGPATPAVAVPGPLGPLTAATTAPTSTGTALATSTGPTDARPPAHGTGTNLTPRAPDRDHEPDGRSGDRG